ncbi:MAG: hypothetical protein R3C68_14270 [Myxococcota bacterium]
MQRRGMALAAIVGLVAGSVILGACQDYEYVFQPDADREGTHLRFKVQTPSKADLLFVIDNSNTMQEEQEALRSSIKKLLDFLAPLDTSYRIGIVSTDAVGWETTCCNGVDTDPNDDQAMPPSGPSDTDPRGNRGNCGSCAGFLTCTDEVTECSVQLRRPHDGALGRLVSAYDPAVFDVNAVDVNGNRLYDIPSNLATTLNNAFPTGVRSGPATQGSIKGVPWVIDRRVVRDQACAACGCTACDDSDACFTECAVPVARSLVVAYFNSNLSGIGVNGNGYEQGIKSALLAVGIDAEAGDQQLALDPGSRLTLPGGANTYLGFDEAGSLKVDAAGVPIRESWVRDDALLAVMFVSDEEDCTAPQAFIDNVQRFEVEGGFPPVGSACYQDIAQANLLRTTDLSSLLSLRKGNISSRIAVGLIGGVRQSGPAGLEQRRATPADCVSTVVQAPEQPSNVCSGFVGGGSDPGGPTQWCAYTQDTSCSGDFCDAMATSRYLNFANRFDRRTFDSICRAGSIAFGDAMEDFGRIATQACFQLEPSLRPAGSTLEEQARLITVKRAPREEDLLGVDPTPLPLPRIDQNASAPAGGAWTFDAENKICLVGLDRLIDDVYDIFVLHRDKLEF